MNKAKKILAVISTLAISATMMFSTMLIAHASDDIIVKPVVTDKGDNTYSLAVNIDISSCSAGTTLKSMQFKINGIDDAKIDTEAMMEMIQPPRGSAYYANIYFGDSDKYFPTSLTYTDDVLTYVMYTDAKGLTMDTTGDYMLIDNLTLLDGVETGDMEISITEFACTIGSTTYGTEDQKPAVVVSTIATDKIPGNKTGDTPDVGTIGEGITRNYADDDAAIGFVTDFTSVTGNTVAFTGHGVDKDGKALASKTLNFTIPELETENAKIGLIVQYNPTLYNTFVLESANIVSAQ